MKPCKGFSREILRTDFNQVHNSAIDIFFVGSRMGAGGILSRSCSQKTSATESLFNQIVGLWPA